MSSYDPTALYVIGHRNPDTDCICAAIGNAAFLREEGYPDAVAARCGHMPKRTEWVLEQAGVEKPLYLRDIYPTAGSVCHSNVLTVTPEYNFLEAYSIMEENSVRSVPIINEEREVLGMLQFMDLLRLLMPSKLAGQTLLRRVQTSFKGVQRVLEAKNISNSVLSDEDEDLIIMVAASSELSLWRRMEQYKNEGEINRLILVCGDRSEIQREAIKQGVRALVLTGGYVPPSELVDLAQEMGTIILSTSWDTASVGKLIRCSRKIKNVINSDFICFEDSIRLEEVRRRIARVRQDLFPVVDALSHKLVGVFSKSDLVDPPRTRVVLVDHNELAQAILGIEEADVVEVLDHHRMGGSISSRNPIRFLAEPVGATSTLVARRFFHRNLEPSKGVALCLVAGILSDTINLTSPTTTEIDRIMVERLCVLAGVDADVFTAEFFAAGSLLRVGENPDKIISADRKEFEEFGQHISISQIEEVGLDGFEEAREGLEKSLSKLVNERHYDFACLLITDVSHHDSLLLVAGNSYVIDEIPYVRKDATLFEAPGVVSRKKQLFPDLSSALRRSGVV